MSYIITGVEWIIQETLPFSWKHLWFCDRRPKGSLVLDCSYSVTYEHHDGMNINSTYIKLTYTSYTA